MQRIATKSHEKTQKEAGRFGIYFCAFLCLFVANASALTGVELAITPGEVVEFTAPLSADLRNFASATDRPIVFTEAKCAVAVPKDFSPGRAWPVLLVSATSDPGYNSSRALLRQFAAPALKAGWIVIAADPPSPVELSNDTDPFRYALLMGALDRLRTAWPDLNRWPRAFGGFSGGAKRSGTLAAFSLLLGHPPIGVFQAGCNQATLRFALSIPQLPRAVFLATPVFLSSGHKDPIATPAQMEEVRDDLARTGFRTVKFERFTGSHEVHAPHVEEALTWFSQVKAKSHAAKVPSSK
jgi:hypothetical protein